MEDTDSRVKESERNKNMKRSEYEAIIQELAANTFSYAYKSLDETNPHEEEIEAVEWQDIVEILGKHTEESI